MKKERSMSKRRITGTASERGRRIFIKPGNSSMQQLTYGRIRLCNVPSQITFSNEGQETGLICVAGAGYITAGGQRFAIKANEALYVPKGMSIVVETSTAIDLVECSAPVEGEYPVQF